LGGSLRLGANQISIKENSLAAKIYKTNLISKRHRHRFEFNKEFLETFEKNGMIFSGESDNGKRMRMALSHLLEKGYVKRKVSLRDARQKIYEISAST